MMKWLQSNKHVKYSLKRKKADSAVCMICFCSKKKEKGQDGVVASAQMEECAVSVFTLVVSMATKMAEPGSVS